MGFFKEKGMVGGVQVVIKVKPHCKKGNNINGIKTNDKNFLSVLEPIFKK
jgi:hypothetical protein